jgi:hypothetical protein
LSAPGGRAGKLLTANPRTGALAVGELAARIEEAVATYGIGLVILDPLVRTHSISENDNGQMDALAQLLTDMACKHDIAIDLPHHVSKGAADPGNADRGRGASATNNAARLVWTLSAMTPDKAGRFGILADDRRDYVRLDRAKLNVARSSGAAMWFKLISVAIGNGTETYPAGDSVQTVEIWTPPETWAGLDSSLINQILTAIDTGPGEGAFYTHANAATDRKRLGSGVPLCTAEDRGADHQDGHGQPGAEPAAADRNHRGEQHDQIRRRVRHVAGRSEPGCRQLCRAVGAVEVRRPDRAPRLNAPALAPSNFDGLIER